MGKLCDKVKYQFMINTLCKLETEGNFLNVIMNIIKKL